MKHIAVLLTVHNRKEKTLRCLHDLFVQESVEGYTIDVWLTDDGCTDGTPEVIVQRWADVHIVKGDGNLYWKPWYVHGVASCIRISGLRLLLVAQRRYILLSFYAERIVPGSRRNW